MSEEEESAMEILNRLGDGMEAIWPQMVQWTRMGSLLGFVICAALAVAIRAGWRFSNKEKEDGDNVLCYSVRALCCFGAIVALATLFLALRDLISPEISALNSLIPGK